MEGSSSFPPYMPACTGTKRNPLDVVAIAWSQIIRVRFQETQSGYVNFNIISIAGNSALLFEYGHTLYLHLDTCVRISSMIDDN